MSNSKYCFLSCIQISQEMGKVVWHSHHFKNFQQFVVIHGVKDFSVVDEAEVDSFLEYLCFFYNGCWLVVNEAEVVSFLEFLCLFYNGCWLLDLSFLCLF